MIEKRESINITLWFDSRPQSHQTRFLQGQERLFRDYFAESPVFPPHLF